MTVRYWNRKDAVRRSGVGVRCLIKGGIVDYPTDEIASRKAMVRVTKVLNLQYMKWSYCGLLNKEKRRREVIGERVNYVVKIMTGRYWYRNRVGAELDAVWDAGVWLLVYDKIADGKSAWRCVRKDDVDCIHSRDDESGYVKTTGGKIYDH